MKKIVISSIILLFLFVTNSILAQEGGLVRKFPGDQAGSVTVLKVDASGIGYALTNCESVLITNDNGDNWNAITIPNWESVFTKIAIEPESNGMEAIILSEYQLLKTIDGGQNWTEYQPDNVGEMQDISYFPNGNQILLANNNVYVTSDGTVWNTYAIADTAVDYTLIETGSNETIYAFAPFGFVTVSNDAGVTWSAQTTVPGNFGGTPLFQVIDAENCFVARFPHLYKTSDGGDTWDIYVENAPATPFTYISETELYFYFVRKMFHTTDKGMTYSEYDLPNGEAHSYPFVGVDEKEMWTSNGNGAIRHTIDRWTNWEEQREVANIRFNDIVFKDEMNGVATGDKSAIYATSDGGESWQAIDLPAGDFVSDVVVGPNGTYYLSINEPNILYSSTDLSTFTVVNTFDQGIEFITANENNIIVQTEGREVFLSENLGVDWTSVNTFTKIPRVIDMLDDVVIIAGSGLLEISKDGGETWTDENETFFSSIWGIEILDNLNFFLMTQSGFYKTNDGGLNWDILDRPTNGREIAMLDANEGFALGFDGVDTDIFWTEDGGESFSHIHTSCHRYWKMYLNPFSNEPYFVGSAAVIDLWSTNVVISSVVDFNPASNNIHVYPNPNNGDFRVEVDNDSKLAKIKLYELNGKLVHEVTTTDNQFEYRFSEVPKGFYMLTLQSETGITTTKLIVE